MKKTVISLVTAGILIGIPALVGAAEAPSASPSASNAPVASSAPVAPAASEVVTSAPLSTGTDSVTSAPFSTGGGNVTSAPFGTGGGNLNSGGNANGAPFTTGGGNLNSGGGNSAVVTPTPTVAPIRSSGSSSSGSFMGIYPVSSSCPLITAYMKRGWKNDPSEVLKLQAFLKNITKAEVDLNGVFDEKTENAVRAFQVANLENVLGPWGVNKSTGMVYITTLKKINQIACNQPLVLNPSELATINSFKKVAVTSETQAPIESSIAPSATDAPVIELEQGSNSADENVATAGKASVAGRFWNFIVNLFR